MLAFVFLGLFIPCAMADTLCIKKTQKVKKGKVRTKKIVIKVEGTCPKAYIKLSDIDDGSITSEEILDGTVATADLGDASVSSDKLQSGAVTAEKIQAGTVSLAKLGSDVTALGLNGIAVLGGSNFHMDRTNSCTYEFEGYWGVSSGNNCCLHAPLHLPDNISLTEIEYIFLDTDAGGGESFEIELRRKDLRDNSNSVEIV